MRALLCAASAAIAGAALLGVALVVFDDSPFARLGMLAGAVALLGGQVARVARLPLGGRLALAGSLIVAGRLLAGLEGAVAVAVLVSLGWALRLCLRDWLLALAVYGIALAAASGVSARLVVTFWILGGAVASVLHGVRSGLARRSPGWSSPEPSRGPHRPKAGVEEVVP